MQEPLRCRMCGSEIDARARFCRNCGVEIRLTLPGLLLRSALAWRARFGKIGWWEGPQKRFIPLIDALIEKGKLPGADSASEPWILFSNGQAADWKLRLVHRAPEGTGWLWQDETAILATRCRIAALDLARGEARTIWYKDIRIADRERFKETVHIHLADNHGQELRLGMAYHGTRLMDVVGSLGPPDSLTPTPVNAGLQEGVVYQIDFHELIAQFLTDICQVASQRDPTSDHKHRPDD